MKGFLRGGRFLRQSGAVAMEFALVFPILFLLTYGTVVYGYVFFLKQSVNYAAQQGAEAAVSVDPDDEDAEALRQARVVDSVKDTLRWLPANQLARVVVCDGAACNVEDDTITVEVEFQLSTPSWLFPAVEMPGIGAVPPMPTRLEATAAARLYTDNT
ncbi:TadE/TadG family type IV pilus assembly protein [Solimonas sp. K1W22B-7]|uniref:TadE/TadG family type IV pilus assembly protein n=1 Tax=Solimonas sp. K1W22B-7 TaxID=2303331 RepID=UPI0013C42579|nr:TadE/TadG family type IV pilus assembly protein [Solimonas sp. K1W22B-7]